MAGGSLFMDVPSDILSKLERYCAFQERCETEVRRKLTETPCSVAQREEIIRLLRDADFLNEERYVQIFIRSKIHDQWGKLKIRQALAAKKVDTTLTEHYLDSIDEEVYFQMLQSVMVKWKRLHPNDAANKAKLFRFLLTRGFSTSEVMQAINMDD